MKKENKWLGRMCKGIIFSWILAMLLVLASIVAPILIGGMAPESSSTSSYNGARSISSGLLQLETMVSQLLVTLSFIAIVLVAVFSIPGIALSVIEIAKAGNAGGWKALWILIVVFLSGIGVLAYWHVGRKSLILSSP